MVNEDLHTTRGHVVRCFSQSNPSGEGSGDVPGLLRRVATSIEQLGDVQVLDVTFHSEPTGEEDDIRLTVYFDDRPRNRPQ